MATPEEIQKLLKDLEKVYKELGTKNPFANFDASKVSDASAAVAILNAGLRDAKRELDDINGDLNDTVTAFKKTVDEIKNTNSGLTLASKTFSGLSDIARKLKSDQAGINELSGKELKTLQKQAKEKREDLIVSKDLLTSRISELKELEKKGELNKKNEKELIQSINAAKAIKNELKEQDTLSALINGRLNQRIKQEERIEGLLGLGGASIEGAKKALDKLGFEGLANALGLDKVKEKMEEVAEATEKSEGYTGGFADKMKVLKSGISEAGVQFKKSLTDPTVVTTFLINEMVSALISADKATGELAKSFGTSYSEATSLRNELNTVANLSGDINVNTAALQKSLIAINKEFGIATMLSGELLKDFTQLTTVAGYTEEAALGLSKITVATGTDLSKNTSEILGQAMAFNATNKLALNEKEIVEGVAKASAATTLSLGMQPKEIAKAVAQSKALGVSLQQVEQIASSLLNFESSISSELEAELLTGKELNLEEARRFALNNDIAGVAREIAKQIGTAANFTKMNVIQQEALAKSVGMTREDLAKSLIERQALAAIGEGDKTAVEAYNRLKKEGLSDDQIAARLGDEKLAAQLKSQSVQERFNASIEKLREIFVSLAGPVLQIVSPFVDLLNLILPGLTTAFQVISFPIKVLAEGINGFVESLKTGENILANIGKILTGIATTYGVIKAIQLGITAQKLIQKGLDVTQAAMGKGYLATLVAQVVAYTIMNPVKSLIGLALAGTVGAAIYSQMKDGIIDPSKGPIVSGEFGSVQLSEKDTAVFNGKEIIAGTNLFGDNSNQTSNSSPAPSINLSPLIERMMAVENVLVQILNKEGGVYLDGTKVGTAMAVSTYRVQ
jgi:hypothetical protein